MSITERILNGGLPSFYVSRFPAEQETEDKELRLKGEELVKRSQAAYEKQQELVTKFGEPLAEMIRDIKSRKYGSQGVWDERIIDSWNEAINNALQKYSSSEEKEKLLRDLTVVLISA